MARERNHGAPVSGRQLMVSRRSKCSLMCARARCCSGGAWAPRSTAPATHAHRPAFRSQQQVSRTWRFGPHLRDRADRLEPIVPERARAHGLACAHADTPNQLKAAQRPCLHLRTETYANAVLQSRLCCCADGLSWGPCRHQHGRCRRRSVCRSGQRPYSLANCETVILLTLPPRPC